MFKRYRLKKQLESQKLEFELNKLSIANNVLAETAKNRIVRDTDKGLWMKTGGGGSSSAATEALGYDHYEMLTEVFKRYHTDLFARAIVRNLSKFVLGKGPQVKALDGNQKVQDVWKQFCIDNKWSLREKELVRRTFRDGEVLLRKFVKTSNGTMKVRFVQPNSIKNPESEKEYNANESVSLGIGTSPDDIEDVKTYYRLGEGGKLAEKIKANEIMHIKILNDSDMKRGISILLTALPMIQKYMGWLDDRIVLNQTRSAIALVRTVEGTASTVESIRDAYRAEHSNSDENKQQAMKSGTVLTASKGVSYAMLSPNISASDVKDDGRSMLLAVCAGMGMPEMFLTADFSNANYSSSMIAQNPFVREIEDWQDFFAYHYKLLFREVIEAGIDHGELPKETKTECLVEWPPLITADIKKNNEAREIQHRNKVLSKKTWQHKEGLDPDIELTNMEDESNIDIFKEPFNMPTTPTNQYGSEDED